MKVHRWRSQNQWFQRRRDQTTWFYAARGGRGKNPPQDLGHPVNPGNDDEGQGDYTSTRRLVRAATPRREFQNMRYTNHQYMTKIFQNLQRKLGITEGYSTFSMEALKTNVLIWRKFMSSSMKAAIHLGRNNLANLEVHKNTNFEEIQSFFSITQKWILEHSEETLNVQTIESASFFVDEISIVSRSSDPVGQGKSTCPLRFRSMCGEDE